MRRIESLKSGLAASLLLGTLLLTGCEIDLSEEEEGGEQPVAVQFTLSGEAHGYQAMPEPNATVWVADAEGNTVEATTDLQGDFNVDVTNLSSPLVVVVKGTQGVWYSYVANASQSTLVMVNPLTSSLLTQEVLSRYGVLDGAPVAPAAAASLSMETGSAMTVRASTAETLTAEQKFQLLKDEGVFDSFEDGSVGLDEDITRGQVANIVGLILGLENTDSDASEDMSFGFLSTFLTFQQIAEQSGITAPSGSPFTPSVLIKGQMEAMLAQVLDFDVSLEFDGSGNGSGWWKAMLQAGTVEHQLLDNPGLDALASRADLVEAAASMTNSLNSFKLANPSTWSYSISGSISGDYNDVLDDSGCITVDSSLDASLNFTEDAHGCLIVGAGATLPVNEGELAHWVKDVVREKLDYYGGNFQFNTLELDATGTGVVGSKLEGSASGRVSVKLGPEEESANFTIGSFVLTRTAPSVMY